MLLDIAALVDKYACAEATRHAGQHWISQLLSETDSAFMSQLLIAAYYFKLAELFKQISVNLVMRSETQIGEISTVYPPILDKVFGELRSFAQASRIKILFIADKIEAVKHKVIEDATRFFESQIKHISYC